MSDYEPEVDDWRPGDHRVPLVTTDTEALIATVREVCSQGERAMIELGWTMRDVTWRDRLDALAAELERRENMGIGLKAQTIAVDRAEAAEAELERVKAERDNLRRVHIEDTGRWIDAEASLDKALTALRETRDELNTWLPSESSERLRKRIDAAIAEIEGEK